MFQYGHELGEPVHQRGSCWWEKKAHTAFIFKQPELLSQVRRMKKKLALLEVHHLYYLVMVLLPISLPTREFLFSHLFDVMHGKSFLPSFGHQSLHPHLTLHSLYAHWVF